MDLSIILTIGSGWMMFGIACALYKANQSTKVHPPPSPCHPSLNSVQKITENEENGKGGDNFNSGDEEAGDWEESSHSGKLEAMMTAMSMD